MLTEVAVSAVKKVAVRLWSLIQRCTHELAHVHLYQVNNSIQSLSLEWNSIGTFEQGIQRFADGLEVNGSLTKLILCNNHIGAQVAVWYLWRMGCSLARNTGT